MVQVDPIQVPSAAAYEKYAARSCVLSSEQSRGFKCGICLGALCARPCLCFRALASPFEPRLDGFATVLHRATASLPFARGQSC